MRGDEFFGLPEYVVNSVVTESAGNGGIRVYNYVRRGAVFVPQFMALLSAVDLVVINREIQSAVQDILREGETEYRKAAHH